MSNDMRPTDLWEVATPDGHRVGAILVPQGTLVFVVHHIDGKLQDVEEFADWEAALRRASELRLAFLGHHES